MVEAFSDEMRDKEEGTDTHRRYSTMKVFKIIMVGITAVAILMTLGTSAGCAQEGSQEYTGPVEKITLGVSSPELSALIWVAENQGYFNDNGLNVTIKEYISGKDAVAALLAGEVDIATASSPAFVVEGFEHANLRILAILATANRIDVIARKDHGIAEISDLKGKTIGVSRGTSGEFFLGTFLLLNELSLEDVEIVDLRPPDLPEAILNGDTDATATWATYVYSIINSLGENAIIWDAQSGQPYYWLAVGTEDLIDTRPAAVERFLKAMVQAEEFLIMNEAAAQGIVLAHPDVEKAYLQFAWPKQRYDVVLPQHLLLALENEAKWSIDNNLTDKRKVPNYLDFVYLDGLEVVKPKAVTIIH